MTTKHDETIEPTKPVRTIVQKTLRHVSHHRGYFKDLYLHDTNQRIAIIRAGLPADAVELISLDLAVSKESVYDFLGVTRATVRRQAAAKKPLSSEATERAVFISGLVKMLQDMIPEGQGGDFDAAKWVARWLESTQPALAGAAPKDYLDTAEGRAIVKRLLGTIESGAYV